MMEATQLAHGVSRHGQENGRSGMKMAIHEAEIKRAAAEKYAWRGFVGSKWKKGIDVRDFIVQNVTPYYGDESFLAGPTEATKALWDQIRQLNMDEIRKGGVLDVDVSTVSTITAFGPGYLDKAKEKIVGLQTDKPFKRAIQPFGGIRMVEQACKAYGFEVPKEIIKIFTEYRKTHNQGVFDAYTDEMRLARKAGIITGLPDA